MRSVGRTIEDIMTANRISPARLGPWIGLLVCVVAAGCGRQSDLPPTAEVSGTVKVDGRPLARGAVKFVPDATKGTKGPPGVGYIDEEGHYEITTAGIQGAVVGHHKIGVEAEEEYDETKISVGRSLIPRRYNNPDTSRLAAEVKEGEKNEIPLELSSRP